MAKQLKRRQRRSQQPVIATLSKRIGRIESAIEQHYFDTPIDTNIGYDGTLVILNPVPLGDTDTTRTGDALANVRADFKWSVTKTTFGTRLRMIVFKDHQNTVATPGDLLASTNTANSFLDNVVWDNRHSFKILKDFFIRVDGIYSQTEIGKFTLPLKRMKTQFSSGTVTIRTGALKLLVISDGNAALGPTPALDMWVRLVFEDL